MPRTNLGPWLKLYATTEEDLAHYTDAQFRAFVGILCRWKRGRGELPKLQPLEALYGADVVQFLVGQKKLAVGRRGTVTLRNGDRYDGPIDRTNAARQKRYRDARKVTPSNGVTVTQAPSAPIYGEKKTSLTEGDGLLTVGDTSRAREGLPHLTEEAVALLELRTGRSALTAGQRQLAEFDRLIADHGLEAVGEAFLQMPVNGHLPTARQLVWSAVRVLEPFLDPPKKKGGEYLGPSSEEAENAFRH